MSVKKVACYLVDVLKNEITFDKFVVERYGRTVVDEL